MQGSDGRADLADAVGRVPDVELLLVLAQEAGFGERRFLELVLLAADVGDAVVEIPHGQAGRRQRVLDRLGQAVGAQRLF